MKRELSKFTLYYYVILHILAVLGTTGICIFSQINYPGIWNWPFLILVSLLNYYIFSNMFSYIVTIKRKK